MPDARGSALQAGAREEGVGKLSHGMRVAMGARFLSASERLGGVGDEVTGDAKVAV
jgi:hypothetical protein